MIRRFLIVGVLLSFVGVGHAEPIRTVLTKENRLPRQFGVELGALGRYIELDTAERTTVTPYARYGVLNNLALFVTVPYERFNPDFASSESGIGDVSVGMELRTFEDLFGYPWVMPHFEVSFDTGDEDKGLGAGENIYTVGLAVGTTTHDKLHWAADARYRIRDDSDNIPSIAASIVWDLDEQFSFLGEIEVSRDRDRDTTPVVFLAGMYYKGTDNLHFGLHGGTSTDNDVDVIIHGKVAYSF